MPPGPWLDQLRGEALARAEADHNAELAAVSASNLIEIAGRLGLIDSPTRDVLLSVYSDGLSGREAAARHQTSPEMIRFRCSKAVRRLAQHSVVLAQAA